MTEGATDRWIRRQKWLDAWGEEIQDLVGWAYRILGRPGQSLKNLLHGTTLPTHHPLHPMVTDVVIGAWAVAFVADIMGMTGTATLAIAVGLLAAGASLASGYTDFHSTFGQERRVATLHGLLMTTVSLAYLASLVLRSEPNLYRWSIVISSLAFIGLVAGGWFGGHLVFAIGTAVNRNAFTEWPKGFAEVGASGEFDEGQLKVVDLGGAKVLLVRHKGQLFAISDTCSHAGGPLHEGELIGCTIKCPWHESRFCVKDGVVEGGPATIPQPTFVVREEAGRVSIKATK